MNRSKLPAPPAVASAGAAVHGTASIRDVAELAGVSVGTVSNVLNRPDIVRAATVERVHAAINELGFVRNDAARQLRAGRSTTIGLLVLDVRNPFFTDVARGAEDEAASDGLSVVMANSDESAEREASHLDYFETQRVLGMLISPIGDLGDRLERLRAAGTPVVLVDRTAGTRSLSSVAVDDVEGGRLAAQHVLDAGRHRLAFVGGPRELEQMRDRLAGARAAAEGVEGASVEAIATAALGFEDGRRAARALLSRPAGDRPDALLAGNDLVAIGALQVLMGEGGLRVPEDMAIVGYDDIDFASAAVVPLSSIRQPRELIGQTAVQILREEAQDPSREPRQVLFKPELVVRASTAGRGAHT
ncbi:LacI family transcriptional regulator [Sinomonas cyclohexanicum]|uniref:LacI family transcriptional regulator n=1 Tax=Sinomonas cyclohexanicum TaxID=322009 RepID=A0ABM7PYQ3_SINCY|nr:LacI family DNA-binding transcriptional regulator [Corynebacterium cyclohexanicum]BCT77433.1 LacI family transcriptional regulator [Corynebacterium cyclohexanicum]